MNLTILIARLTADPEHRATATGKPVTNMRVAIPKRDRDAAPDYVDVVAFDGLAEVCANHLEKGRQVAVVGRLSYREWEADDGSKRSKHEVVANEVEFLSRPRANGEGGGDQAPEQSAGAAEVA